MTVFDYLTSPPGVVLVQAIVALLVAVTAYIGQRTHHIAEDTNAKVTAHLNDHIMTPPPQ